jgi:hypothetical protein
MSRNDAAGFGPARPAKMTAEEFQSLGHFFKEIFAENPLIKIAIYAAGLGGALDSFHILWLFLKWAVHCAH